MEITAFDEPFRHWHLKDVLDGELLDLALADLPDVCHPDWIRYENDAEQHKWTMERGLPNSWNELLDALARVDLEFTGVPRLRCDLVRRGAGLHVTFPNGVLAPHLDYALHPSGLERRLNLIYFCEDSEPDDGGKLGLYDPSGHVVKEIDAQANEAVVFECSDISYHGVSRLAKGAKPRVTAASYYLTDPRPGCVRRRATFLPIR